MYIYIQREREREPSVDAFQGSPEDRGGLANPDCRQAQDRRGLGSRGLGCRVSGLGVRVWGSRD